MKYSMRLVAYAANGPRLGVLPSPLQAVATFVHNDVGALSLVYTTLADGGPILERGLEQGLEVAVEVASTFTAWSEPDGGRFILIDRDRDASDTSSTLRLTLPSYGWLLGKVRNLDRDHLLPPDHTHAGKRPMYTANAGTIMATFLQENEARGGVPLARTFTPTADSTGAAWSTVNTLYYDLGLDMATILRSLTSQGMCDWRTRGRTLRMYRADTEVAFDLSVGNAPVRLHMGDDVTEAPERESLSEVVGRLLMRGEDGLAVVLDNPSAPTPWGVWEGYESQGGVSDEGTMRSLAQAGLAESARVRGQYTRGLSFASARKLPLIDYLPGNYILAPGSGGKTERVRVQQITLTLTSEGIGGNVVLNDRFVDADIRRTRRTTGIVGGSTRDGGSGVRPAPEGPDKRQPAAPVGLVVQSNAYLDPQGVARAQVSATYSHVNTATDGTAMEIVGYGLWGRPNETGAQWTWLRDSDGDEDQIDHSPLPAGEEWAFRVRARGRYSTVPGAWSAPYALTLAEDTTPPPLPSQPIVQSAAGIVTVEWDGLTEIGAAMPVDFDRSRINVSPVNDPNHVEAVVIDDGLRRAGIYAIAGLEVGAEYWIRLQSVDTSDNAEGWSPWASVVVESVWDADTAEGTVGERITAGLEQATGDIMAGIPAEVQAVFAGKALVNTDTTAPPPDPSTLWLPPGGVAHVAVGPDHPEFVVNDYTTGEPYLTVQPLWGGQVRFTALAPGLITGWSVDSASGLGDGRTYTHTFAAPGTVWVRYNDGSTLWQAPVTITAAMLAPGEWVPLRATADTQPPRTATTPPVGDGTVVGEVWWMFTSLGENGSLVGWWQWDGTDWQAKALDETFLPKVHIGDGSYGVLSGTRLEAGTVAAEALAIGLGNRIVDPTFKNPELRAARASTVGVSFSTSTVLPSSSHAMDITANRYVALGHGASNYATLVDVAPGDRIAYRVHARRTGTAGSLRFYYFARTTSGSLVQRVAPGSVTTTLTTTGAWYEWAWEVPSDVAAIQMGVYITLGTVRLEQPYWAIQSKAILIEDGAITAPKLAVGAVGAREVRTNDLWADNAFIGAAQVAVLVANSIQGVHIAGDAIGAKHTLTGPTIQTRLEANRGIKITGASGDLVAYDASGNRTYRMSGATGEVEQIGRILAGTTGGHNVEIAPNAYGNRPGTRWDHGATAGLKPVAYSVGSGADSYPLRALVIHGSEATINSTGRVDFVAEHGGDFKIAQAYGPNNGVGFYKEGDVVSASGRWANTGNSAMIAGYVPITGADAPSGTLSWSPPLPGVGGGRFGNGTWSAEHGNDPTVITVRAWVSSANRWDLRWSGGWLAALRYVLVKT